MKKHFWKALCVGITTLFLVSTSYADDNFVARPEVQSFIKKMVVKYHFDRDQLIALFKTVKMRPRVLSSIKAPMEQAPWYRYRLIFINDSHIRGGVEYWNRNAATLAKAEKMYGVPASLIVATIGTETKYGKNKGEYPVIDALSNIAFSDSPRARYFLSELEEFLLLSREQHLNPLEVKGSYAGAIGQPQFMPSSYRRYAVNFSGSGKIDLSNNEDDIIGSIANYYQKHGWHTNEPVAIPTVTQNSRYRFLFQKNPPKNLTIGDLASYGIYPSRNNLPENLKIKIIALQDFRGNQYWVGLHNFDVIKRYNASDLYAMAVYQLSYYIDSLRGKINHV